MTDTQDHWTMRRYRRIWDEYRASDECARDLREYEQLTSADERRAFRARVLRKLTVRAQSR